MVTAHADDGARPCLSRLHRRRVRNLVINDPTMRPAHATFSLGFNGIDSTSDNAIQALINAGVTVTVAAGNSNVNACDVSPAHILDAITVAAIQSDTTRASYSNYGSCVDVYAPGSQVYSAWIDGGYSTISGTSASRAGLRSRSLAVLFVCCCVRRRAADRDGPSRCRLKLAALSLLIRALPPPPAGMAAPHVAGAVALMRSRTPCLTNAQVVTALKAGSTAGAVTGGSINNTPNFLPNARAAVAAAAAITCAASTTTTTQG